jgi:hypothetical protein
MDQSVYGQNRGEEELLAENNMNGVSAAAHVSGVDSNPTPIHSLPITKYHHPISSDLKCSQPLYTIPI